MTRVLLIEDNPGDARLVREMLRDLEDMDFQLESVDRISKGLSRLAEGGIDAVLLDLSLPDGQGFPTFKKMFAASADVPIILLTGLGDEDLALAAVRMGAQDYLVKGEIDSYILGRSIRYAIERQKIRNQLTMAPLTDPQTGLRDRQGFLTIARKPYEIAQRLDLPIWLLFANIDHLKKINDEYGQEQGDRAIVETAVVLRKTFRDSDIFGRIGGNEFVVLAINVSPDSYEAMIDRLQENIRELNESGVCPFELSLSTSVAAHDAGSPVSLEELIAEADARLLGGKREKASS